MINIIGKRPPDTHGVKDESLPPSSSATAFARHYQPELVDQLKREHRQLLALNDEIRQAFELADYRQVVQKLIELRTSLKAHLLIEDIGLYSYLEHRLEDDAASSEVTRRFHHEMDAIGKAALEFMNKYEVSGVSPEVAAAFAKDFAHIGKILAHRIEKEELILYPLYQP